MNIAVLGATGRTGRPLVAELLRRGHTVAVLVRDPAKLDGTKDRLRVVVGDSTTPEALADLIGGADAVVSVLGPTAKDANLHRQTAAALIPAMDAAGVRRFVGVSGAGIDVPGDDKSASAKAISWLIQTFGGDLVKDKPAEYEAFAASGLDWTLVRPPRLVDSPATGKLEHDAHRSTRSTRISREDLARFLADVVEQQQYVGKAPFVASSA